MVSSPDHPVVVKIELAPGAQVDVDILSVGRLEHELVVLADAVLHAILKRIGFDFAVVFVADNAFFPVEIGHDQFGRIGPR